MAKESDIRRVTVEIREPIPDDLYAVITLGCFSVLTVAGIAQSSFLRIDRRITAAKMTAAFDQYSESYPWGV